MKIISVMLMTLILSSCATMGRYSISESELESHFQSAVSQFDREQLKMGSPLSVALNDVDINIGPDGRDIIQLAIEGEVALNAVFIDIPVNVSVSLEGAPVYISKDKAIYIRRLKLLDSSVNSLFLEGKNKMVTDQFMAVLAKMLETVPVYQLDESDFTQRMLGTIPMDIKVGNGALLFVPAE